MFFTRIAMPRANKRAALKMRTVGLRVYGAIKAHGMALLPAMSPLYGRHMSQRLCLYAAAQRCRRRALRRRYVALRAACRLSPRAWLPRHTRYTCRRPRTP